VEAETASTVTTLSSLTKLDRITPAAAVAAADHQETSHHTVARVDQALS
jgi:hypothetical protein